MVAGSWIGTLCYSHCISCGFRLHCCWLDRFELVFVRWFVVDYSILVLSFWTTRTLEHIASINLSYNVFLFLTRHSWSSLLHHLQLHDARWSRVIFRSVDAKSSLIVCPPLLLAESRTVPGMFHQASERSCIRRVSRTCLLLLRCVCLVQSRRETLAA